MKKSYLLSPAASLYGAVIDVRRALYAEGVFKSYDLGAPVVSVGNITVGGTGKTPLVAYAARVLADGGEKVCILTRGYKRENERARVLVSDGEKITASARQSGDEPFELACKLLGRAAVVADANRAEAGKWARANLGSTAFVLDDGFQHLKVRRDLDIVCIDATNPFGSGKLLPSGILREPLKNLKRADLIVITRANLVDEIQITDLKNEIARHNRIAEIFVSQNKIANLINLKEFPGKAQSAHDRQYDKTFSPPGLRRRAYAAFCGLGSPESFFEQMRRENFNLATAKTFPDHYFYQQNDIDELETAAEKNGAEALLTTAKDAVKLQNLKFKMPCFVVESELVFDDEAKLRRRIQNLKSKI